MKTNNLLKLGALRLRLLLVVENAKEGNLEETIKSAEDAVEELDIAIQNNIRDER